nr:ribonuclease H-like domain-containing protein [Tanacetum cinerariifolium]
MNNFSSVSKGFQPKFTPKLIQSSPNSNSQTKPKFQKDYKSKYKKMKAKLALLEASPSSPQNPKTLQPKNKGLVAEIFDWNEEKVFDNEEVTQVKVLMALDDDELTVGKSHAQNGEWIDISIRKVNTLLSMDEDVDWQNDLKDDLLSLKQAKLDVVTFQIQNTELTKLNHALQEQLKEEKKINEKWLTRSKKVSQCISEQTPHQKKKVLGGELLTESLSKININENTFIPASMGILVLETQAVNESLETLNTPESSKDYEAEFLTPLPPLKNLQGASPSSEVMPLTFQPHSPKERPGLGHNRVIHIRGGVLAESSQSNESSIGVKCNTCGSTIHSTSDHNEFDHFKRESKLGSDGDPLSAYTDVDWAGCPVTRWSTSGYFVFLEDNLLSWSAKRQVTLSRSSAEAEYRCVANVVAETAWIRNLLCELHTPLFTVTLVYCDNVSAVYMSANPVQHQRTKHFEIDIHFVRDFVASGQVRVLHVSSRFQYADIFTKGLPTALFIEFRSSLNVRRSPAHTEGE